VSKAAAAYAEEALDWFVRVQDPDFAGWDALSAWLAASARHAEIVQKLALPDEATGLAGDDQVVAVARSGG
jgi:ferric-dicitrate binding protein FerR (iron transport regulator)